MLSEYPPFPLTPDANLVSPPVRKSGIHTSRPKQSCCLSTIIRCVRPMVPLCPRLFYSFSISNSKCRFFLRRKLKPLSPISAFFSLAARCRLCSYWQTIVGGIEDPPAYSAAFVSPELRCRVHRHQSMCDEFSFHGPTSSGLLFNDNVVQYHDDKAGKWQSGTAYYTFHP